MKKIFSNRNNWEVNNMPEANEVIDILEEISGKIMERGFLSEHIEEGNLSLVSLSIDGNKETFEIIIKLTIDERDDSELTDDEWDYITERVNAYFQEKKLWSGLEACGFTEDNCDGFDVEVEI